MGPKDTEKITVEDHGKVYLTSMLEVNVLEVGLTLLRWSMELYYLLLNMDGMVLWSHLEARAITAECKGKGHNMPVLKGINMEASRAMVDRPVQEHYISVEGINLEVQVGIPLTEHLGIRLMEDTTEVLEDQVGIMEMVELVVLDSSAVVPTCHGWHLSSCHKR